MTNNINPWNLPKNAQDITDDLAPLVGRVVTSVAGGTKGDETMTVHFADGSRAEFFHRQDCCESVSIEDVAGDWSDLIGAPLSLATVTTEDGSENEYGSSTWTFYRFAGGRGTVVVRWLGESNGYYSEQVSAVLLMPEAPNAP